MYTVDLMVFSTRLIRSSLLVFVTLGLLGPSSGCRGLLGTAEERDCDNQTAAFEEAVAGEGALHDSVPAGGPYPMAMVLSEEGVNRMLRSSLGEQELIEESGSYGPLQIEFTPTSPPALSITPIPSCARCVLYALDFDFGAKFGHEDLTAGSAPPRSRSRCASTR